MTMTTPVSNPPSDNWYFQLGSYFGEVCPFFSIVTVF
jgi:hypothetical protein